MKKVMLGCTLMLLWLMTLFTMHIACFDFFEANFWYFYIIAVFAFYAQVVLMRMILKVTQVKSWIVACSLVYCGVIISKGWSMFAWAKFAGTPVLEFNPPLTKLCIALDVIALLASICLVFGKSHKHNNNKKKEYGNSN